MTAVAIGAGVYYSRLAPDVFALNAQTQVTETLPFAVATMQPLAETVIYNEGTAAAYEALTFAGEAVQL